MPVLENEGKNGMVISQSFTDIFSSLRNFNRARKQLNKRVCNKREWGQLLSVEKQFF